MKDMVQVRITAPGKHFIPEGYVRMGQTLWVTRERAEVLINKQRIASSVMGPSETKPGGPSEGKASADAGQPTSSTDSASSLEHGTVRQSSVSQAARVSSEGTAASSKKRGARAKKSA